MLRSLPTNIRLSERYARDKHSSFVSDQRKVFYNIDPRLTVPYLKQGIKTTKAFFPSLMLEKNKLVRLSLTRTLSST